MQDHPLQAGVPVVVRVFEREYLLSQLRSALQVLIFSVLEGPKDNEPLFNHTLGVGALLRSINGILSHGRKIYNAETNKHFVSLWDSFIDWFQNKQLFAGTTELITEGDLYVLRTLPDVTSDDIRSLATVAVLLNRRTLHLFLETLLKDQVLIEGYYETYSILYDAECKSTLLLLLRGLNSLNFKLSIIDVPKISNNVGRSSATEEIESSFTESKDLHSTLQISPSSPSSPTQSKNDSAQNTYAENFDNLSDFTEPKSPQNPPSSIQQMNDDSKNLLNTTTIASAASTNTTSTTSSITSTTQPSTTNVFSKTLSSSDSPQSIDISQFHDVHDDYCGDSDDDDFVFVNEGIRKPFVPVITTNTPEKKNKKKKKKKKNTPKIEDWTPSKNAQDSIDSQTITEPQLSTTNIESPTNTTFAEISTTTTITTIDDTATTNIDLTTTNQHSNTHSPNTPIPANNEVTATFFEPTPTPNSESITHDLTTSETVVLLDIQSEKASKSEGQGDAFDDQNDLSSILDHFVEQKKQLARNNLQETLELLINTTLEPVINNVIKKFGDNTQNSTTSFSFKRIHKQQEEEPSVGKTNEVKIKLK